VIFCQSLSKAVYKCISQFIYRSLYNISHWKTNCIGNILQRKWLLQEGVEGKIKGGIEVTGRRGRRRRKLLDDFKGRREYLHLKEEAVDRAMWRAGFARGFGTVVRQTA
jgi:hypothetical protein